MLLGFNKERAEEAEEEEDDGSDDADFDADLSDSVVNTRAASALDILQSYNKAAAENAEAAMGGDNLNREKHS